MSDFELRKILRDVMDDLDQGRLRLRGRVVRKALLPAVMAAGLGLGVAGCDTNSVGNIHDAGPDGQTIVDAAYMAPDVALDAVAPAYMGPIVDGGTDALAPAYMGPEVDAEADDAEVDSGPHTLYMGPPPIDPD